MRGYVTKVTLVVWMVLVVVCIGVCATAQEVKMTVDQLDIALARARNALAKCENDVAILFDMKLQRDKQLEELSKKVEASKGEQAKELNK